MDRAMKKPKTEEDVVVASGDDDDRDSEEEDEEALVAFIEHKYKEVEHLTQRLEETRRRLSEDQSKIDCLRRNSNSGDLKSTADHGSTKANFNDGVTDVHIDESQSQIQNRSRSQLLSLEARQPKISSKGRKENKDPFSVILSLSAPCTMHIQPCTLICSHHKRKMRSLALNPVRDEIVTRRREKQLSLFDIRTEIHAFGWKQEAQKHNQH